MAPLTALSILLILYSSTHLITPTLATTPHNTTNATNTYVDNVTLCRDTDIWLRPSWPADIPFLCGTLIHDFFMSQPEISMGGPPLHEFLPEGMMPDFPDLRDPVRTPWRFRNGACTLAVTTLHSVPAGYLPAELGARGPFPLSGTSEWWNVWDDAEAFVLLECVRRGRAGMTWNRDREAIGVFLFATGSVMDEMLGVSPAGSVVGMGGVNGTGDAVMTMNGTGDAMMMMNGTGDVAMEDVEVAKSRRWYRKGLVS